ncbi:Gamma-tubulin complex component 3 [Sarcoptes scabiei]|uniref:Gamma-tubulin complex component 3 n=1 Tax=Sarcoptes scabiei TaxID=52283 RepID=A0A834VHZ9_SARSC|nr:Gamma-tubulin complex component 3 [Sarcoptes scabiei]UXI21638.1 hypothetical protein NH340_JMT07581 [Sarcoptes scabiei]
MSNEIDLLFPNVQAVDNEDSRSLNSYDSLTFQSSEINANKNLQESDFNIIREVLSMLNGLNVETIKKNPSDLFMFLRYRNDIQLDDASCQMIIRIAGLGKILLKIVNYLNYHSFSSNETNMFAYPIFDDDIQTKTLGNIKQYFINSVQNEIKEYHYDLLMIESKFRSLRIHYSLALRRILMWSTRWSNKFVFIVEMLKTCIDSKGIEILNQIYDLSQNGDQLIQSMARSILHQSLKPFIFNMFDWLLYGEIDSTKIDQDFFIKIKENTIFSFNPRRKDSEPYDPEKNDQSIVWNSYELNVELLPKFMKTVQIKKILSIGNSMRLLRYMIKDEYDQKMTMEILSKSAIKVNYDIIKKFLYKNIETLYGSDKFFFEHNLVDDFDLLLESYNEVINDEMFNLLNLSKFRMEFEMILGFVLLQRGDFYESLVDYLLPLLKKPSEEIINTMNANSNNQLKIFNIFMVNSKLIDLNQLYKIDSLMFDNFDLHENLQFTFNNSKNIMKHHLGWDCFSVRYKFTKNVYRIMLDDQLHRYERLFKQLFYMKRVLFSIRKAQHQVMHFNSIYKRANPDPKRKSFSSLTPKMSKLVSNMLNTLHFLFFHMFGFSSRMYRYFGSQINSLWSNRFATTFKQKQNNHEMLFRSHHKFLGSIEQVIFFNEDLDLLAAYSALNDSIIDFCESFCEETFFPFMNQLSNEQEILFNRFDLSDLLFRHQFKISVILSKYRCCIRKFIQLCQLNSSFDFKYDILSYQPCLDRLFKCLNLLKHSSRRTHLGCSQSRKMIKSPTPYNFSSPSNEQIQCAKS